MTSPNESTHEPTTNPSETENSAPKAATSRTSRRSPKSSLVKADPSDLKLEAKGSDEVVFVLEDNTRIVATEYLPNHRPISLSDFTIVGSLNMAGDRPIMADPLQVFTSDELPGHRPIAVSSLPISDLGFLPGNRPIASNDIIDPPAPVLMGYLD